MSASGRGRGYTGRHHLREPRPGDSELTEEQDAARTLAELSPRSPGNILGLSDGTVEAASNHSHGYISQYNTQIHPENKESTEEQDVEAMEAELNVESPDPAKTETNKQETKTKDTETENKEEKPGSQLKMETKTDVKYHVSSEDDAALQELLNIDEQYTPLLTLLEQFSPGEDGIQFNRKLRHFESTVTSMCPDEARLQQVFATFRAAALAHGATARKLAAVGASFTRQQRQQLLRGALLNVVMQGTFTKLDVLERANPMYLVNAANLMGDYFAEARLCNGNKVHILAGPLLHYLRALLAARHPHAHRSLATQLMQNGRELLGVLAQELDELSISIRLRLLNPPTASIIWLLLSSDLCLNKFLPLPNTLQQFYASHLDLATDENYSEVSYGSWKKSPEKEDYRSDAGSDKSVADKMSHNLSQISLNHEDSDAKPKLRPILGAGAGLLRQEQALGQDNFDTWTAKTNLTKRYDLNSWRQVDDEKEEEPAFNPTVLPPNLQTYPVAVPDYPPPAVARYSYPPDNFLAYLQQGDGAYIQGPYAPAPAPATATATATAYNPQGDGFGAPHAPPDRVNNETQKTASRRPPENWRRENSDLKEDANRNRHKNWSRQRSRDNVTDDEDKDRGHREDKFRSASRSSREGRAGGRAYRRSGGEGDAAPPAGPAPAAGPAPGAGPAPARSPARRHASEVPRGQRYWDHDDRCDKDYNS